MTASKPRSEENPYYGLYIGYSFVVFFVILGLVGLILFIFGFYAEYYQNIVHWLVGIILVLFFLWPGIGMLSTNIAAEKQKKYNFDFVKIFKKAQILDCGCGTGRHAIPLAKQMTKDSFLTGIDIFDPKAISRNALERVQKNAELEGVADRTTFRNGSVTDIPFEDKTFDIVTCMAVIHHLHKEQDRAKAFNEIYRVLTPKGIFYLRELNKFANISTMGFWSILFLHNSTYWSQELENHNFRIVDTYKEKNTTVFLAKKE